jgi:hypothetical protein
MGEESEWGIGDKKEMRLSRVIELIFIYISGRSAERGSVREDAATLSTVL